MQKIRRGYSERYDSYYDLDTGEWTESVCSSEECDFCKDRPEKFSLEERNHIGYTEREEGYYKLYAPAKGMVVTQAFILCKYCNGPIYHCSGPRVDAVCFECHDKEPDLR